MISIIGAGPVGSYAAGLLAEKGKDVQVFEEHNSIGRPVQCTGIVTKSLGEIIRFRQEFVVNRLKKVRIYSPDGACVEMKTSDVVIDRTKFDRYIAEQAKKKGAKIFLNCRLEGIKNVVGGKGLKLRVNSRKQNLVKTDVLVGADGPNSLVSRFMGNKRPEFWMGMQAVVKMPVYKTTYSVYFGKEIPGFFGWVVPETENRARIGLAASRNPRQYFNKLLKKINFKEGKHKIIEMQGGLIPKYTSNTIVQKDNAFIVGDAATQVKATTGGGLVPGLRAAECLTNAINKESCYKRELRAVDRELKIGLFIRNMLDRFSENDYNRLIKIINEGRVKHILNKENRDNPSKIIFKLLIREPKLLYFAGVLFRVGVSQKE